MNNINMTENPDEEHWDCRMDRILKCFVNVWALHLPLGFLLALSKSVFRLQQMRHCHAQIHLLSQTGWCPTQSEVTGNLQTPESGLPEHSRCARYS